MFFSSCDNIKILFFSFLPPTLYQYKAEIISSSPQTKKIVAKTLCVEVGEFERKKRKIKRSEEEPHTNYLVPGMCPCSFREVQAFYFLAIVGKQNLS